jgi:hypothetical protein
VDKNGKFAYVTLQENNAVAVLDIRSCSIKDIFSLGECALLCCVCACGVIGCRAERRGLTSVQSCYLYPLPLLQQLAAKWYTENTEL